jgi:hypothetical protein
MLILKNRGKYYSLSQSTNIIFKIINLYYTLKLLLELSSCFFHMKILSPLLGIKN